MTVDRSGRGLGRRGAPRQPVRSIAAFRSAQTLVGGRRGDQERRGDHDHRRERFGVRPLDDGHRESRRRLVKFIARPPVFDPGSSCWRINVLLLVLGCFLEVASTTLLMVMPILAPALKPLGVDPVAFRHRLHPQHGDRAGSPAGRAQSLCCCRDDRRRRRSPRWCAAFCRFSSCCCWCLGDHHLCPGTVAVAATAGG